MKARPFHDQRPLAAAAAAYGAGGWAGASFSWRPWLAALGFALAAGIAALLPRAKLKRAAGGMALFLLLGVVLGGLAAHPGLPEEGRYLAEGTLSADAVLREDGTAAAYLENAVLKNGEKEYRPGKLYWTYNVDEEDPFLPREGDRVAFAGKAYHPQGRMNPYGFDFRMFLLQKGIAAGISGAVDPEVTAHPGRGLSSLLYHAREKLAETARAVFGADSALPEALLLGEKDGLPEETRRSFSDAGAAHVLAVSGLHVGLLAAVLLWPLRRWASPKARLAVLSVFLLLYSALLDFPAPVVRASLLMLITLERRVVRRAPDLLTGLCAAFLVILLIRPLDLLSASFQLSFCAVLGITALEPPLEKAVRKIPFRFLREGWAVTLSATAGTALPSVQLFHRFSLAGLAVNPFVCAVFGVLLPLYALALILGCVYLPLGMLLGGWINPVTRAVIEAVRWLGALPGATVNVPYLPWYCCASLAVSAALCTRYVATPWRKKLMAAIALAVVSLGMWRLTVCRDVQYVQLAMGQEDAALVLDSGKTAVIDAGEHGGDLSNYLLATGRRADHLILTHLHRDHCLGVRRLMNDRVPIGSVYLPEGAEEQEVDEDCLRMLDDLREMGVPVRYLKAGDEIRLGRAVMTVTWPWPGTVLPGQDANRYSLVSLWDLGGVKVLSAGDLTGAYELYAAADADVLKVSHHGSKNSTGEAFLRAVSPSAALITGSYSGARLPSQDTLERLKEAGVESYNTGKWGALTLTVKDGRGTLIPYLNDQKEP